VQKTVPAQHRTSLRWPERHRGFLAALRTHGMGLSSRGAAMSHRRDTQNCNSFRFAGLHRLGSFVNCLSWKNNCSPDVKTKSAPQSTHFNILSWYSIEDAPSPFPAPLPCQVRKQTPPGARVRRIFDSSPSIELPLNCLPLDSARHVLDRTWIYC